MAAQYTWSRFLYSLEHMGLVAVFHVLHPEVLYFQKNTWKSIVAGSMSNDMRETFVQKGLLVVEGQDSTTLIKSRAENTVRLSRPTILYLMLAQGCNNICTYCPIPALAAKHGNNLLTLENAVAGLDIWREHMQDYFDARPYYLILYGGEPLLNRSVLEDVLVYVQAKRAVGDLPAQLEIILPTNGLLIDAPLAQLLKEHDVLVSLGIDGPPTLHDTTRKTADGAPTSAGVLGALRILQAANVRLSASVTLTPYSVRASGVIRDYLRTIGIPNFGFNVLKGTALQCSLAGMTLEEYYVAAARAVLEGYADTLEEFQLQKKLNALLSAEPFGIDCTCYGNQIVVQADGTVTNCPFLRFELGNVRSLPKDFRIANTDVVKLWRTRLPLFTESLETATPAAILHGGGCGWGSTELEGSKWKPDSGNVIYNKEIVHELIWKLLPEQSRNALVSGQLVYWDNRGNRNR